MENNKNIFIARAIVVAILIGFGWSCDKYFPEERENIGDDSRFTQETFEPILGRNNWYSVFFKGTTTYPATFQIKNIRRRNGEPAPELESVLPVTVWKDAYTGTETSIKELKAKQEIQNRPVLEIVKHSGDIIVWNTARSNFIRPLPDSGYLFDIELSSSGGRRFFRDFRLMPFRERPTEPSSRDRITGHELVPGVFAATLTDVKGDSTGRYLSSRDLMVSMKKIEGSEESKITFRFLDKNGHLINPNKFSKTDWNNLVHGFNPTITATGVTYDVLYPIPLVKIKTDYTTIDGERAEVTFGYERIGFGGAIETAIIRFPFAIYESGNWEVLFQFLTDNPKFSNE